MFRAHRLSAIDTSLADSHSRGVATSRDRDTAMLDNATIEALARAYHVAEKERVRTRAPSVLHPGFTTEDAYAVQRAWIKIKLAEGNVIKGHKIGLTSPPCNAPRRSTSRTTAA